MVGVKLHHGQDIQKLIRKLKKTLQRFFFPQAVLRLRLLAVLNDRTPLVLFQDEARFGRITIPKHCWSPLHVRPVVPQQAIREYTYIYGAFGPKEGIADTLILPDMYASTLGIFLKKISQRHLRQEILMIMDGAPCHRAGKLSIPKNIHLCFLPSYSQECNPAENMWEEIREKWFANTVFKNMSSLEKHLVSALQHLDAHPETVQSITRWPWIQKELIPF